MGSAVVEDCSRIQVFSAKSWLLAALQGSLLPLAPCHTLQFRHKQLVGLRVQTLICHKWLFDDCILDSRLTALLPELLHPLRAGVLAWSLKRKDIMAKSLVSTREKVRESEIHRVRTDLGEQRVCSLLKNRTGMWLLLGHTA